jgi:hypothetical protein
MLKLTGALVLSVVTAFAADVSGAWQFVVETNRGTGNPTAIFQQQGDQISGTFSSRILGEAQITGTVKGTALDFQFEGEAGGQTIMVSYKGTIVSPTAMKGTAVYSGLDIKANWSATKK